MAEDQFFFFTFRMGKNIPIDAVSEQASERFFERLFQTASSSSLDAIMKFEFRRLLVKNYEALLRQVHLPNHFTRRKFL